MLSRLIVIICLCFSASVYSFERDNQQIVIASYPYASPGILKKRFKPLVNFLEQRTKKQVSVVIAKSYQDLINEAIKGKYDLVTCPSHIAAALWQDQQFHPVMHWRGTFSSRLLVKQNSPVKTIADLKDRSIAIPDFQALVTQAMENHLKNAKLLNSRDYQFIVRSTHDRALYELLRGKVDAAIISSSFHAKLQKPFDQNIKILEEIEGLISDVYLVSPNSTLLDQPTLFEQFIASQYYEPYKQVWGIPEGMVTDFLPRLKLMENYKPNINKQ